MTAKISPCLWFDGKAEEAATFYTSTFPDSHITGVRRAPSDSPGGAAGGVLTVEFTILGMPFTGLNGPPIFNFTEAVSFQVPTDTQEETDGYWNALVADGGEESVCGWCKDKYGLSWQIVPRALTAALIGDDKVAGKRAMDAMMAMKKIDIAAIDRAFAGEPS